MLSTGWVREEWSNQAGSRSYNVSYFDPDNYLIPAQTLGAFASTEGWFYAFSITNNGDESNYQEHQVSVLGFDY